MAEPIKIQILTDADQAASGLANVADEFERVSDSMDNLDKAGSNAESALEGVGDAGKDAGNDIERALQEAIAKFRDLEQEAREVSSDTERYWGDAADELERSLDKFRKEGSAAFEEVANEAEDAGKKIDRDLTKALDDLGGEAKKAGDDIGRGVGDGFDSAKQGMGDFKDEAASSGREAAASFSGEFDDVSDLVQEVAANAFGGFGPLGMAAGMAAAVGIGLLTAEMERAKERAQETAEGVADLTGELIDMGRSSIGPEQVDEALKKAATTAEDGKVQLDEWVQIAERAGINVSDFLRGMAGDSEAAARSLSELTARQGEYDDGLQEVLDSSVNVARSAEHYARTNRDLAGAIADGTEGLREQNDIVDESSKNYGYYKDAIEGSTAALEAEVEAIEAANDAREEAAGIVADAFTAEGDYAEAVREATAALESNGATIAANTAEGQANREALVALADGNRSWQESAAAAGQSQEQVNAIAARGYDDFVSLAASMGMSDVEARDLARSLGLIPGNVQTTHVFTSDAAAKVAALIGGAFIPGAGVGVLGRIPSQITTTLKLDDSAIRSYRAPTKYMDVIARPGKATIT